MRDIRNNDNLYHQTFICFLILIIILFNYNSILAMSQTYTEGPYKDRWKKLHPHKEFPDPQKYPHMYPSKQPYQKRIDIIDPDNVECTDSSYCPKGLIDYECQLKYNCYLNIANLVAHLLGFLILSMLLIGVLRKILCGLTKLLKGFAVFGKMMWCVGFCISKLSLGLIGDEVIYNVKEKERSETEKQKQLKKKLEAINLEINMGELNSYKTDRILEVLEDYSVGSYQREQMQSEPAQ